MTTDPEVRFRSIETSILIALLAMGVAALANAAQATAAHVGADLGPWQGLLTLVWVAGYLVFAVLMVGGLLASRRIHPADRARLSDEFSDFVSARAARTSLLVTIVGAAVLMSIDFDWPGSAAAGVLYAVAVITLAIAKLSTHG